MARIFTLALALALVTTVAMRAGAAHAQSASPSRAAIAAAARDIVGKARYATLITIDAQGQPQARIVDPLSPEEDWTIWVGTSARTRKVAEIAANPRVTLLYFDAARESYVTFVATAALVRDPAENAKRWKDDWKPFYKGGPTDASLVLIKIDPARLEISSAALGLNNDPVTWLPVTLDLR